MRMFDYSINIMGFTSLSIINLALPIVSALLPIPVSAVVLPAALDNSKAFLSIGEYFCIDCTFSINRKPRGLLCQHCFTNRERCNRLVLFTVSPFYKAIAKKHN
jgi:hypothetical protein